MIEALEKRPLLWILIGCILVFFLHLDVLYINIMEARNFITAREMVTNGHWIFTTWNDMPRYQKPPLPTWLTAISGAISNFSSVAWLRVPAALAGTLSVVFLYKISIVVTKKRSYSLYAAFIALTSFFIIFSGRNGQWDIFTHSFALGSIYFLVLLFKADGRNYHYTFAAGILLAASILSKGPVSLYALVVPFLISWIWVYRIKNVSVKIAPLLLFTFLALFLGFLWYFWVRYYDTEAFNRIMTRESGNWSTRNVRPFYYYWSFFVNSGIWTLFAFAGLLFPYLKNRCRNKKWYTFTFLWTLFSVILLSLIPEKKTRYLLPVMFPLALNTAVYIEYLVSSFASKATRFEKIPVYLHFSLLIFLALAFPLVTFFFFSDSINQSLPIFLLTASALLLLSGIIFYQLRKKNIKKLFYCNVLYIIIIISLGFPLIKTFYKNSEFKQLSGLAERTKQRQLKMYNFHNLAPEVLWDYGQVIPILKNTDGVETPSENTFLLLSDPFGKHEMFCYFENEYTIKKEGAYDLNYVASPEHPRYRARLTGAIYKLTKK